MKKQMQEKMGALVAQMRAHVDAHPNGFTAEASAKYDSIEAEISQLEKLIDAATKLEAREKSLETKAVVPDVNAGKGNGAMQAHAEKVTVAFNKYVRFGQDALEPEERMVLRQRFVRDTESPLGGGPQMALTTTTTGGGYLIPTGFSDKLEEALKFYGGIAAVADVMQTETGNPLPYPTVNDTAQKATIVGINTQASENDMAFNNVVFNAYKFTSGVIQVPYELLQDSYFDLDSFIARKFGERFGRAWNAYGTTGTGSSQPTGVVTALASASQNLVLATGNTTTISADNLIDLEHSVDPAYRPQGKYMMNDLTLKLVRKLKDSYNRYLWSAGSEGGIVGGNPATLNGYQYVINNDMAVPAANAYSITFGDHSKFKVRQVKGYTLLRLDERYADYGQVAFIAFQRWDSNLLDAGTHPIAALQQSAT